MPMVVKGLRWVQIKNELSFEDFNPKTLPMKLTQSLNNLVKVGEVIQIPVGHKRVFYNLSDDEKKRIRIKEAEEGIMNPIDYREVFGGMFGIVNPAEEELTESEFEKRFFRSLRESPFYKQLVKGIKSTG